MSKAPIIISPARPVLVDKRIEIKVVNLRPFQNVTLRVDLMQTTGKPIYYESYGHFISDMQGTVKVANDASFGGTYKGIDGMGLFWSMLPVPGQRKGVRFTTWDVTRPMEFKVSLFDGHVMSDGKATSPKEATAKLPMPLANATILRTYLSENVERHEISVGRMRGTLFVPKGNGRFPGVIDMFGSHGGLIEFRAALLASHGFLVLALAFYAYKDLPANYNNLELEYFIEAVQWLAKHEKVYQNGIGFVGVSYGAQIALQVAAECPLVSAAVGISPFHSVFVPVTYMGQGIGYKTESGIDDMKAVDDDAVISKNHFDYDSEEVVKNEIEVEKIKGSVLLICGESDQSINATEGANRMEKRLARHKRPRLMRLDYPGTGHLIEVPYMPMCSVSFISFHQSLFIWGGNVKDHSAAQEHSWKSLREFLWANIKSKEARL